MTPEISPHDRNRVENTIPEKNIGKLPRDLFRDTPASVIVVDTGNYYPRERDGRIAPIEGGTPESRWVEQQLGRPVVKAFNNIYARHLLELGRPKGSPGRIALPVAGDSAEIQRPGMLARGRPTASGRRSRHCRTGPKCRARPTRPPALAVFRAGSW